MTIAPALLLLAAAGPSNVAHERLDGNRVRVSTIYRSSASYAAPMRAQMRLTAAAERLCGGRGRAVSTGTLTLDKVPPDDSAATKRGDLRLSEEYSCLDAPAPR